jgi:hypothetical protein
MDAMVCLLVPENDVDPNPIATISGKPPAGASGGGRLCRNLAQRLLIHRCSLTA